VSGRWSVCSVWRRRGRRSGFWGVRWWDGDDDGAGAGAGAEGGGGDDIGARVVGGGWKEVQKGIR